MAEWTPKQLNLLASSQVIRVAGRKENGDLRNFVTVGSVIVSGSLFVRSIHGPTAKWFAAVSATGIGAIEVRGSVENVVFRSDLTRLDEVTRAYQTKYGDDSNVRAMTYAPATLTTLRIESA